MLSPRSTARASRLRALVGLARIGEAVERDQATIVGLEPGPPLGRAGVADFCGIFYERPSEGSIGAGLRVEAEVGPGGGAEILDRRF